jgi:hypothetical protein
MPFIICILVNHCNSTHVNWNEEVFVWFSPFCYTIFCLVHGCYIFKAIVKLLKSPNWSPNIIQPFFILCFHSPTTFIHLGIKLLIPFFHLSFIHFLSHNYIHSSSSKVSIHWKFIKHLSVFHQIFHFFMSFYIHVFHSCNIHHSFFKHSCVNHPFFIQNFKNSILLAIHAPNNVHVDLPKTSQKLLLNEIKIS